MNLMLTSFGIDQDSSKIKSSMGYRGRLSSDDIYSPFYRMPPVNMNVIKENFKPDYSILLLCDKVVMDELSFKYLKDNPHPLYANIAETFRHLNKEGFIELLDFSSILDDNHDLLQKMLFHDLENIAQWITPLRESSSIWKKFLKNCTENIFKNDINEADEPDQILNARMLHLSGMESLNIEALLELRDSIVVSARYEDEDLYNLFKNYLSYVNSNIILSKELKIGFHDWSDFLPFYRYKFLYVGQERLSMEDHTSASKRLFEVSFPEYSIKDSNTLIKMLHDDRIIDLRNLIQEAVDGKTTFDEKFARDTFKKVFEIEKQIGKYRTITSFVSELIPLSVLAKIPIMDFIDDRIRDKLTQEYRWFYLISDID